MRKAMVWFGGVLLGVGTMLMLAHAGLSLMGLDASFNFGNPAKFEFVLVPFWQIGLAMALLGGACLIGTRWLDKRAL